MRWLPYFFVGLMTSSCSFFGSNDANHHTSQPNKGSQDTTTTPTTPNRGKEQHLFQSLDFFSKGKALGQGVYQVSDLVGLDVDLSQSFRCGDTLSHKDYDTLVKELGGIRWDYPTQYYRNQRKPYLYAEKPSIHSGGSPDDLPRNTLEKSVAMPEADMAVDAAESAGNASAPTIQRGDLIGKVGNKAIFLSKYYGLFFIELSENPDVSPKVSCSVLPPGKPVNFYVQGDNLILLTNSIEGGSTSAVVVYKVKPKGLVYSHHTSLKKQRIQDSRLFNSTLAVYGFPQEERKEEAATEEGRVAEIAIADPDIAHHGGGEDETAILSVVKIGETSNEMSFEELFESGEEFFLPMDNPANIDQSMVGKESDRTVRFNTFISASGNYLTLTKKVRKRTISEVITKKQSCKTCVNYDPKFSKRSFTRCFADWEYVENESYDPDFVCADSTNFLSCISTNEEKFNKGHWVNKGKKCETRSYYQGKCLAYENRTSINSYPLFENSYSTEFIVYKFEDDDFIKLADSKNKSTSVPGWLTDYKGVQFMNGMMYTITSESSNGWWREGTNASGGTSLYSFAISGKAFVPGKGIENLAPGESLKAVRFDAQQKRAYFVTFLEKDPLFAVDLSTPAEPKLIGSLEVPGYSSQLEVADGMLIGFGKIGANGNSWQSHVKISNYDTTGVASLENISGTLGEIDTLILGKDQDSSHSQALSDDQVYSLQRQDGELRAFLPYSYSTRTENKHDEFVCRSSVWRNINKLSISNLTDTKISSEADIQLPQEIVRVIPGKENALAFAETGIYYLKNSNGWQREDVFAKPIVENLYEDDSLPEGMIIAKLVLKGLGEEVQSIKFILASKEDISKGQLSGHVEYTVPSDLISCLGNPRVKFYDNNLLLSFWSYERKESGSFPDREIPMPNQVEDVEFSSAPSHYGSDNNHIHFGYRFDKKGVTPLSAKEAAAMAKEEYSICHPNITLKKVANYEELQEQLVELDQDDVQCEKTKHVPWGSIGCSWLSSGGNAYCQFE